MAVSDFRPRVLTVDDSPQVLGLLRAVLEKAGYKVDAVRDGSAAWSLLNSASYSLIITDLNMPRLSGIELLRNMRRQGLETPAILLSGSLDEKCQEKATILGNVECVDKPFTATALLSVISRLIE
jgi:DNA-binding response OmpR family regulator